MSNRPNRTASHSARVARASRAGPSNTITWVVLAAIVAIAGIVAIVAIRDSGGAEGGGESPSGGTVVPSGDIALGEVTVDGDALPPYAEGADDAVDREVPTIQGQSFDGEPVVIEPGSPMVIMGLAHWCPHCQREVPRLQGWLDENGMPDDVELVAVATATDEGRPNYSPGDWLREEGWSVPTLVDDQADTAGQALGVSGYPAFVVVDADGQVVVRTSGEISPETWEALLEAARTGSTGS